MRAADILKLVTSIAACQLVGLVGSIFTTPAVPTWYAALRKPAFTPPNWLFGPVWISLFALMGLSAFLVWRRGLDQEGVKLALSIFAVQLLLNLLWSAMFFGLKSPLAGLVDIFFLWIAILLTLLAFWRISTTAGLLLMPYIIWVSFAAVLNFSIWRLNA
jgi:benzodiazapine receptor